VITKAYGGKVIITFNEAKHYYTVQAPTVFKDKLYQPSVTGIIGMKDKSGALVHWATEQFAEKMKAMIDDAEPEYLQPDLLKALVDVAKDTWRVSKQQAADIGTVAHGVFEDVLAGKDVKLPLHFDANMSRNFTQDMADQANNAIEAGLQFIREHDITVVQAEAVRWSPTYGYIGTGDLIAYIDGKLAVADWKTSKRLYPTVRLQLSAYKHAYEEEYPDQQIEWRVAINTGKDGKLSYEIHDNDGNIATNENPTFAKPLGRSHSHKADLKTFLSLQDAWVWDRENQGTWSKEAPRQLTPDEVAKILNN
jgi:hypothetical protein